MLKRTLKTLLSVISKKISKNLSNIVFILVVVAFYASNAYGCYLQGDFTCIGISLSVGTIVLFLIYLMMSKQNTSEVLKKFMKLF